MDLEDPENLMIILECLRENSTNTRIEHQEIQSRISTAILEARLNILQIRQLNKELTEMKETVENVLERSMNEQDQILDAIEDRFGVDRNEGQEQEVPEPDSEEMETMTDEFQ